MVRYLFYTIGDLTYQSPFVHSDVNSIYCIILLSALLQIVKAPCFDGQRLIMI